MKYFCTYFDRNYLVKGLSMIESLNRVEREEITIYVVCMDEFTRLVLNKLAIPYVTTIPMHEIEELDYELLSTKSDRSPVEYLWTTTPTIILRVIERLPEIDILTYVDADLFFYNSTDSLYNELEGHSVLIHEHRFPEAFKDQEQYGIYNVGLLCFRNDLPGLEVLQWWRKRCIEWCYSKVEDGKFGDQAYLNDWPQIFPQTVVTQNIGAGVAPWNDDQYLFTFSEDGLPLVNGTPVIFYHYHSLTFLNEYLLIPTRDPIYTPSPEIGRSCFHSYMISLQNSIALCRSVLDDFQFGISTNNFPLSPKHALLSHASLEPEISRLGLAQKPVKLDETWIWYTP